MNWFILAFTIEICMFMFIRLYRLFEYAAFVLELSM
jgi:hypothetical protein